MLHRTSHPRPAAVGLGQPLTRACPQLQSTPPRSKADCISMHRGTGRLPSAQKAAAVAPSAGLGCAVGRHAAAQAARAPREPCSRAAAWALAPARALALLGEISRQTGLVPSQGQASAPRAARWPDTSSTRLQLLAAKPPSAPGAAPSLVKVPALLSSPPEKGKAPAIPGQGPRPVLPPLPGLPPDSDGVAAEVARAGQGRAGASACPAPGLGGDWTEDRRRRGCSGWAVDARPGGLWPPRARLGWAGTPQPCSPDGGGGLHPAPSARALQPTLARQGDRGGGEAPGPSAPEPDAWHRSRDAGTGATRG